VHDERGSAPQAAQQQVALGHQVAQHAGAVLAVTVAMANW
jgi:hypothetical protein